MKIMSFNRMSYYDEKIKQYIASLLNEAIDTIYPIGSIYISTNNTSPASLFGGTWEQIKDTFLLACGDTYASGSTGGEAEHVLTVDEMPSHTHRLKTDIESPDYNVSWAEWVEYVEGWTQTGETTESPASQTTYTGGNQPHNNMPPYLTVYMWQRIE